MRGEVLSVDAAGGGVIAGSDGNRYAFAPVDWKGPVAPAAGEACDFLTAEGAAREIFPLRGGRSASSASASPSYAAAQPSAAPQTKSEGSSQLLGILGIVALVLAFIIPVFPAVVGLVLGLMGADSAKRHKNESGLTLSRIAWIGSLIVLVLAVLLALAIAIFAWPLIDIVLQYMWQVWEQENATPSTRLS